MSSLSYRPAGAYGRGSSTLPLHSLPKTHQAVGVHKVTARTLEKWLAAWLKQLFRSISIWERKIRDWGWIWIEIVAELLKILLGFVLYINEYEKVKDVPLCKTLWFWILPGFFCCMESCFSWKIAQVVEIFIWKVVSLITLPGTLYI